MNLTEREAVSGRRCEATVTSAGGVAAGGRELKHLVRLIGQITTETFLGYHSNSAAD